MEFIFPLDFRYLPTRQGPERKTTLVLASMGKFVEKSFFLVGLKEIFGSLIIYYGSNELLNSTKK